MACTTILVGKKASYDGSTMIARTEDSQSGVFTPKEFLVVTPEDQPRHYQSVLSKFSIDLIILYVILLFQMHLVKTVSGVKLVLTQLMLP